MKVLISFKKVNLAYPKSLNSSVQYIFTKMF